jgi:hypothetical protein
MELINLDTCFMRNLSSWRVLSDEGKIFNNFVNYPCIKFCLFSRFIAHTPWSKPV